jgi:hypothetical protein
MLLVPDPTSKFSLLPLSGFNQFTEHWKVSLVSLNTGFLIPLTLIIGFVSTTKGLSNLTFKKFAFQSQLIRR